jgi:hypothetical protein
MAKNIEVTAGSGTDIAADEVIDETLGTVKTQYIKLMDGTLESTEKIGGDTAYGLDVDVTRLPDDSVLGITTGAKVVTDAAGTLQQYLRGIIALMIDTTPTDVSNNGTFAIQGGGNSFHIALTVTNGAYTIGDVVGGLITITNASRVNGGIAVINSVKLAAVLATLGYELWLFNADLATPNVADNAALTLVVADSPKILGVIPIAPGDFCSPASAFPCATVKGVGLQIKAGAATTSIYGYLKAVSATSPGTTNIDLTIDLEYLN